MEWNSFLSENVVKASYLLVLFIYFQILNPQTIHKDYLTDGGQYIWQNGTENSSHQSSDKLIIFSASRYSILDSILA